MHPPPHIDARVAEANFLDVVEDVFFLEGVRENSKSGGRIEMEGERVREY